METKPSWESRLEAIQRWRLPSALMGRAVTEAIVAEAKVEPGMRVLDVASGTGEPAISIATALQGAGLVVATDLSADSLKIAEERADERGLTNIEFRAVDVHKLPFADGSFDRVTSRCGVMFFSELPQALAELYRVLSPGGRISLLAWGPIEQPYFQTTIGTILRILPEFKAPPSGLQMFKFEAPGTLTAALGQAGFDLVQERTEDVPWNWQGTPRDFWEYFQQMTVPFKPLVESIPAQRKGEVDEAVLTALESRYDGKMVRFTAKVVLASGIRYV